MYIEGYAFKPNCDEIKNDRAKRYAEIKGKDRIKINNINVTYARNTYYGKIVDKTLSHLDILLLCDNGNTCFGGTVDIVGDRFVATVYTD